MEKKVLLVKLLFPRKGLKKNEGKRLKLVKRRGLRSLLIKLSLSLMVRIHEEAKKGKAGGIKNG